MQKREVPSTIIEKFAIKLASSGIDVSRTIGCLQIFNAYLPLLTDLILSQKSYPEQPDPSNTSIDPSNGERKRPMLTMRNIGSVHQLEFFVNHISLYVYQANLSLAPPDMAFIEGLLQNDLLEGDMD